MEHQRKVSESIRLGMILSFTGGFLDAYSYLARGGVFANAETGNIVLMGIHMAQGNWKRALMYLVPVTAFALGVFTAELLRERMGEQSRIHWKEGVLWLEIVIIFLAGLLPQQYNSLVNLLIAFICAMQVEAFRKMHGMAFATTMCTGNLRSGTELLALSFFGHDKEKRTNGLWYYWINGIFIVGAAAGTVFCRIFGERAIWCCILSLAGAILFVEYHKREAERI